MARPALLEAAASAALRAASPEQVAALNRDLVEALGPGGVSTVEAARRAASTDFAHMSPILTAALPDRPADLVAYPTTAEEVVTAVRLAHLHRVPVTPRGRGTGNYGQAVPLAGGLVLDLTRCARVLQAGDGWLRADAGTSFVELEAAARAVGQELAMFPTTVGSSLGGFLAGGAGGVGSVANGWLWDGYVVSLEVVTCPPARLLTVHGGQCRPYLHAYGVTGIIAAATVRLVAARDWVAVLASFPDYEAATEAGLAVLRHEPAPRLISIDDPALVATYPPDPAMPPDRVSLRAVIDSTDSTSTRKAVEAVGGRVEDVRPDGAGYLTTFAFNHVTLRALRARPELCHLQVSGEALLTRPDEVRAALPGAMLHLDGLRAYLDPADPAAGRGFGGLLLSEFRDAETLYRGIDRLTALGVHVVDPHTWLLGGPALPAIAEAAARNDPDGLLNPGKLP